MTRLTPVTACVALLALPACDRLAPTGTPVAATHTAREQGKRAANEPIAAGTLKLREYPPTPASAQHGEYVKLLTEKGIGYEVRDLPPGVADADFRAEVGGWNEAMQTAIQKKFGPTILADLREEANKRWEERVKRRK